MIRVAILADTHGYVDPRVAELVAGCDLAVHGGDIGNAGVLARLQPRCGRVLAVVGNNDLPRKWAEHERHLLDAVPEVAELDLPGGALVLIHGHQTGARDRHERLRQRFPHARAIVYGHSHRLVADREEIPWVLNPGAAGRERTFGGPSCMVLSASGHDWDLAIWRFDPLQRRSGQPSASPSLVRSPSSLARSPIGEVITLKLKDKKRCFGLDVGTFGAIFRVATQDKRRIAMTTKRKELIEAIPRRELSPFDEMDRLFDTLFHRGWLRPFRELWPQWAAFEGRGEVGGPRVDLIDRDEEILVRAEVPGVEKNELQVELTGQLLTIKGEHRREEKEEEGEFFRAEISRGSFSRTIRLPQDVDFEKSAAEFKDGMLEIHLPKTQKTDRRRIEVK